MLLTLSILVIATLCAAASINLLIKGDNALGGIFALAAVICTTAVWSLLLKR